MGTLQLFVAVINIFVAGMIWDKVLQKRADKQDVFWFLVNLSAGIYLMVAAVGNICYTALKMAS